MNLDNVIKQGYLKKTTQARRLTTLFKRDVKRWFIFGVRDRQPYLEYYEKEESIFREPPINVFDLSNCKQITYTLSNRNPIYTFCIVWENHAMELSAYTRADMLDWCSKLENALRDLDIIAIGQVRGEDTEHVYVDADFLRRKKDEPELEEELPTRPIRRTRATVHGTSIVPTPQDFNLSAAGATSGAAAREVILLPSRRSWDCTVENKNYDNMLFNDDARLTSSSGVASEEGLTKSKSFDTANTLKSMSDCGGLYLNMLSMVPLQTEDVEPKASLELRDSGMGRSENSDENIVTSVDCDGNLRDDDDSKMYEYESICDWSTVQADWAKKGIPNGDSVQHRNIKTSSSNHCDDRFTSLAEFKHHSSPIPSPQMMSNDDSSKQTFSELDILNPGQMVQADFSPCTPMKPTASSKHLNLNPFFNSVETNMPDDANDAFFCHPENTYVVMPGDYSETETDLVNEINHVDEACGMTATRVAATLPTMPNAPITTSAISLLQYTGSPIDPMLPGALKPILMSLRGRYDLLEDKEAQKNIQLLLATCRSRGSSTSSSVSGDTTGSYRQDSSSSSLATTYEESQTGATDEYGNESESCTGQDRVSALPVLMEQIHEDESESSAGSVMTVISQNTDGVMHDIQKRSPKRSYDTQDGLPLPKPIPQPRTSALNSPKDGCVNMLYKSDAPPLPSRSKSLDAQAKVDGLGIQPVRKSDPVVRQKSDAGLRRVPEDLTDVPALVAPPSRRLVGANEIRPPIPARRVTSRFVTTNQCDVQNDPPIPDEVAPVPPKRRQESTESVDEKVKWKGISPGIISQLEGSLYLTNAEDDEECLVSNFLSYVQTDGVASLSGGAQQDQNGEHAKNWDGISAACGDILQAACATENLEVEGACAMPVPQYEESPHVLSNQLVKRSLSSRQQIPTHSTAHVVVPLKQTQADIMRLQIESATGVSVELQKSDCLGVIAFVDLFGAVWVAGWNKKNKPRLHDAFHIGDRLVSINAININSSAEAQKAIKQVEGEAVFMVRRMPHAKLILIHRAREGQNLGIQRVAGTAEIAYVDPNGLSAQYGLTSKAACINDSSKSCTWMLTEINNRPLSLSFKALEIEHMLNAVGKDITLIAQPSELIHELKKQLKHCRGYKNYLL